MTTTHPADSRRSRLVARPLAALGLTLSMLALAGGATAQAAVTPTQLTPQPTTLVASLLTLKVTYSATLKNAVTGAGIGGETVTFGQGGATCSGVSDGGGAVSCSVGLLNVLQVLLAQPFTATFAGSSANAAASATGLSTLA